MYQNKVSVLYWCPYVGCVINGLEWQHGLNFFFNLISMSVNETSKKKNYSLIHNACDNQFFKKIFCNLTSMSSLIVCRLSRKKMLRLVLFSRDGRVIASIHIFFGFCLIQLKGLNPQKIRSYISVSLFPHNFNLSLLSNFEESVSFNTFKQNIKCMNNIIRKGVPAPSYLFKAPTS